jgi:hypothetical protein
LLDEWLSTSRLIGQMYRDYAGNDADRRALFPERPAFRNRRAARGRQDDTGQHDSLAALGRKAAAANWSDNVEERRKALFSYLRQGVACLAWDNIARGSAISCPHIEAALTAAETSDRVLGVSRVETVPSTTVQIFTGNSITPRAIWPAGRRCCR